MTKARVQQWNKPNAYVVVDTEATKGATLGVNLYDSTGRLLTLSDFAGTSTGSGPRTTDYLPEGRYRLYFTAPRAVAAVAVALVDSATVTWTYDSVDGTITATASGSVAWGSITGTLSDQTDLQAALDAKANTSSLAAVATSGDYNDLSNLPTLGTAAAANVEDFDSAGSASAAQSAAQSYADSLIVDSIADADTTHAPSRNAVFDALALKAPLASPALTDTPTAPTASPGTNNTQIATTAYADAAVAAGFAANDAMTYQGAIDASTNPNYPEADAGDTYRISVAGKIGGGSGPNVEVGDMIICHTDSTVSGDHATVGAQWDIIQTNIDGALTTSDIGVSVQAYNANATSKYAVDVGNGSDTAIVVTHNLGTRDVQVVLRRNSTPWDRVECDDEATTDNTVTLRFVGAAPPINEYRCTVIG